MLSGLPRSSVNRSLRRSFAYPPPLPRAPGQPPSAAGRLVGSFRAGGQRRATSAQRGRPLFFRRSDRVSCLSVSIHSISRPIRASVSPVDSPFGLADLCPVLHRAISSLVAARRNSPLGFFSVVLSRARLAGKGFSRDSRLKREHCLIFSMASVSCARLVQENPDGEDDRSMTEGMVPPPPPLRDSMM